MAAKTFIEILKNIHIAKTFCEILKYNHNHDEKGQFASNPGNGLSASWENTFSVRGFRSKQKLNNHWQKHKKQYEKDGILTKEQYLKRALELLESSCGNGVEGYKTSDGDICRYDKQKNDYAKGHPSRGVNTMFKPDDGYEYFKNLLGSEGITHD